VHDEDSLAEHAAAAASAAAEDEDDVPRARQRELAEALQRIDARVVRLHGPGGGFKIVAEVESVVAGATTVLLEGFGHSVTAQVHYACEGEDELALVRRAARWNAEHRHATAFTMMHGDGTLSEVLQADLLLLTGGPAAQAANDQLLARFLRVFTASVRAWELKLVIEVHGSRGPASAAQPGFWGTAAARS